MAATGYKRKYAVGLLNQRRIPSKTKRKRKPKYDETVKEALLTLWYTANQICSKKLVPFLPELLEKLEEKDHLSLPSHIKSLLLSLSPAIVSIIKR
jgi:hypothetical protein